MLKSSINRVVKEKNNKSDLSINRGAIITVTIPRTEVDDVFKVDITLCVVPKKDFESEEYEQQRKRITSSINHFLKRYVVEHDGFLMSSSIVDINFSSANLRKGYNKLVQVSMYVRSRNCFRYSSFRERIKDTIKPTIRLITDKFREEGYKCYKKKQKVNNKSK